ncbi:ABC transporter ATP-binding protein [Desulfurococcus mucosus]|uniref:Oligopeptide/dipeptide ABC transporter, ATPase subunit n=1 Tax=Desulfurococcus mucosus (strain ATCC 35584 / DSM 2162 / JCM 9187 / O7/1) TaxID=765177 RepID=E8R8N8_DESM0|nr:ABC transporter ATP-binding protein [Desulfurococcus mucosus]ADV64864.1 oligopeptide/dipeptide ABC transporter, ATPase subunit [Desulfurococcus mucosus DSM 2162]
METLVKTVDVAKYYYPKRDIGEILRGRRRVVKAVDGVTLDVYRGEVLSIVGESGSGKTTLGRIMIGLEEPSKGTVLFHGKPLHELLEREKHVRLKAQMIYQDPYSSLDPRVKIGDQLAKPLVIHRLANPEEARIRVMEMLKDVGLTPPEEVFERYPHQLSGGQRQRIAIARAMLVEPEFLVADEPVSMIDVSLRAGILELLMRFKERYGLTMVFITHDLSVAKLISNRIAIMYLGKVVEVGDSRRVLENPLHPYTRALLSAVPSIHGRKIARLKITGEIPDPFNIPSGCRFHPRCPYASEECRVREPGLVEAEKGHLVACFKPLLGP